MLSFCEIPWKNSHLFMKVFIIDGDRRVYVMVGGFVRSIKAAIKQKSKNQFTKTIGLPPWEYVTNNDISRNVRGQSLMLATCRPLFSRYETRFQLPLAVSNHR